MRSWQTYLRDGRDVFRRHWKLLVLPIPLALLITIWVVVSTPTMYQSQAAIWSNTTAAQSAALNATEPTPLTPAAIQQSLLNELLSTNAFRTSVASSSPLAAWLASHPESRLTPSGLVGLLHGSPPMSERIKSALLSGTSTAVQGPQVLSVSFKAQSPTVARATLTALLSTFAAQRTALVAQSEGTLQILDAPSTPAGPTSGASKSLATILIGLLAGVAVTIAAVAILVLLKDRKRRATAPDGAGPDRIRNAAGGIVVPVAAATALATSASLHGGGRSNGTPSGASEHAGDGGSADASQDEIILAAEQNGSSAAEVAPRRTASRAPADEDSAAAAGADVSISGIVRDVRVVRNGEARRVVWVVATSPGIPAIARRSRVTLSDAPDGAGIVRRVETRPEGVDLYVEFTNAATDGASDDVPAASDRSWVGHDVTLTTDPAAPRVRVARKSGA